MAEEQVDEGTLDQHLTETLRETLSSINERGEGIVPEETKAEAAPVEEAPVEDVKGERARGPDGKFIKGEAQESAAPAKANTLETPTAAVAPEQAAAIPQETEQPLVGPAGQQIDLNRAPSSWKPAAKAAWANLPAEVRAEIYRREGDFHLGNKPLKENADFGQRMRTVTEPYRAMVEAEGGTLERSIDNYFKTAQALRNGTPQQKLDTLLALDRQFGAGLQQQFQQAVANEVAKATGQPAPQVQQQQPQQVYQDPRVDQLLAYHQKQEQSRIASEQAASNAATEKFISAKDGKGQPLYPFVDNVIDDMSARVAAIRQANPGTGHEEVLKLAYEQAVWANPETRAVLIGQQQAAAAAPVETLRKVEKAKAAAAVNVPKRGSLPVTASVAKFGTPEADEDLRATYRQLTNN